MDKKGLTMGSIIKKIALVLLILIPTNALAHTGETDSRGGHHDYVNGGYHYHDSAGESTVIVDNVITYIGMVIISLLISILLWGLNSVFLTRWVKTPSFSAIRLKSILMSNHLFK